MTVGTVTGSQIGSTGKKDGMHDGRNGTKAKASKLHEA